MRPHVLNSITSEDTTACPTADLSLSGGACLCLCLSVINQHHREGKPASGSRVCFALRFGSRGAFRLIERRVTFAVCGGFRSLFMPHVSQTSFVRGSSGSQFLPVFRLTFGPSGPTDAAGPRSPWELQLLISR
ncbi:hypothetical protein Q8A67_024925 [Cirrhinus molitorella]|uniref:Uncharacterized protein n=1 Tax=Cirrhinus molitorella TaxID=172907 RepID=A0AA88PDD5_9TELE|nr:hypothetical protein Q8A67_024925 [Cirrhinus molitorella]